MRCTLISLLLILDLGCSQPQAITSMGTDLPGSLSGTPIRIEIFLSEASSENNCAKFLESPPDKKDMHPSLIFNSLAEFETQGFTTIQVDHVPAWKKMLIWVVAIDPHTDETIGNACAENVEVEKNSVRDVHLELTSAPARRNP